MTTASFGTILVPLDGSATAERALPVAAALAHRSGAALHLATVHVPLPTLLGTAEEPALNGQFERELRAQREEYLTSAATAIATTHGIEATCAVLDLDGTLAKVLADHARIKRAGLIVMTTHGHGGISRLWLGSVADGMLRRVKMPVLLLHSEDGTPHAEFRNIALALDGSADSEQVLEPAITLGSLARDAHYTLVQVVEPPIALITRMALQPAPMRPHWQERQENAARSYLERVAERLRHRGLAVTTQVISARGVGEQIVDFAERNGADLMAVGTHGARGMERLLLGSVADKVVRGTNRAVLVVPFQVEHP
jgi:nucleotide-binding universal stress UspA family protein